MDSIEKNYNEWNKECWEEYNCLFPEARYTIWDGVIFPERYAKSPLKIMFMNRESSESNFEPDFKGYDLAEALREQIIDAIPIFKGQTNLRQRLKEYLCVVNLLQTGELMSISEEDLMNRVNEQTQTDNIFYEMMPSVAYINVKKSDGQIPSYVPDLKEKTIQGLRILEKQISFFNPSIILAGNVVDGILDHTDVDWGDNLYIPQGKHIICIYQLKINDILYPIVDMYHPSAPQGWMSTYYLDLFGALKAVEHTHPNYWGNRMNLPCFKKLI